MAIRVEPPSIGSDYGAAGGATLNSTRRLFNAHLAMYDAQGNARPYLAAELPRLNTDTWQVNADGSMVTTYRLKPNLVWHDGSPLTADDFVFASQVYASPALGIAGAQPATLMDEVVAPDPTTLTIRWNGLYAEAGELTGRFPPLPRHLLEKVYQNESPQNFAADPYWTTAFIGAGPYKLAEWTPGASIEAVAFPQHVLGAPKISRVRLVFIPDPQTLVTNILAGEVHIATPDSSLGFQNGLILRRQWAPTNAGTILQTVGLWRASHIQFRPEFLTSPGLADQRVRAALALTMDKDGIDQALFEGEGIMSEVPFVPNTVSYYPQVDAVVTKYPFDASRAQAQMAEAGYTRGADGVWASPTTGRLSFQLTTTTSTQNERELAILGAGWRQVGFDVSEVLVPIAAAQSGLARSNFPGISAVSFPLGEDILAAASTAGKSAPENNWTGRNRSGWTNAEFDRFANAFTTTMDQQQRIQAVVQMARIYTQELPAIPMYFTPSPAAFVSALTGPAVTAPGTDITWNIQDWELR
jgi:peptide/nickel transport system substrate-binding protein